MQEQSYDHSVVSAHVSRANELREEIREANHRIELLTRCIEKICVAGGMIRGDAFISGPQALQFGEEFADYLESHQVKSQSGSVACLEVKVVQSRRPHRRQRHATHPDRPIHQRRAERS